MTKQHIRLSSSALSHSACILDYQRTVIEGYKSPSSAKAVYGVSVAKFCDIMYRTKGDTTAATQAAKKAFDCPKECPPDKQQHLADFRHLMTTCFNFWTEFVEPDSTFEVLDIGGSAATEQSFSIPYYEDDYIIITLEGTPDKIGKFKGGCFAIGDLKTTSTWQPNFYLKRYELSKQLRFYRLALKLIGERNPSSTLGQIGLTNCGAFIDVIFIKPNANDNEYKRSEVFQYSDKDLNDFQLTIDDFIKKVSFHVKTGYFPKEGIVNGSCEHKWGYCDYWAVCKAPENVGKLLLERDFKKVEYTPLNYRGGEQ